MSLNDDKTGRLTPYSIALDLEDAPCLVVGGGIVAFRKIESLVTSGAKVKVVSPEVTPEIEGLEGVEIVRKEFHPDDLDGMFLVISATDDREVNESVAAAARQRSMLVNVVDVPEMCNFYVNAQVSRGDLTISVSTGGASPALAKRIRKELEAQYGDEYAAFLMLMREYRPLVIGESSDGNKRQEIFANLVNAGVEKILRDEGEPAAREAIERIIREGGHGQVEVE